MIPSPEWPELYGFVCLYSTLLPQAGRQLELCWRTSREFHPSEDLSKLRTGVSLWADGIMATLAPSANVFKLPDMTAWAVFIKEQSR